MRRIWAAGAAIVVCLSLGGMPVSAAELSESTGMVGSIWQPETGTATYVIVHPDGTMVVQHATRGIGLGVWEPTGDGSLSSRVDFTSGHQGERGTHTSRSDWLVDDATEIATLTSEETFTGPDGVPQPLETSTLTLRRLHMAPMPENAVAPTPPDTGWQAVIGPARYDRSEAGVMIEPYSPPNHTLEHADGTTLFLNPYIGDGVGLWAPVGEDAYVGTAWFPRWRGPNDALVSQSLVNEETGRASGRYGTSDGFEDSMYSMPMRFEPLEGDLVAPDPDLWPTIGSVWQEPYAEDDSRMVRVAYLADGTAVTTHPRYGVGVGEWRPIDEDTFASNILYKGGDWSLKAESTLSEDGESLTTRWQADANLGNPAEDEEGTSTANRMRLEP